MRKKCQVKGCDRYAEINVCKTKISYSKHPITKKYICVGHLAQLYKKGITTQLRKRVLKNQKHPTCDIEGCNKKAGIHSVVNGKKYFLKHPKVKGKYICFKHRSQLFIHNCIKKV